MLLDESEACSALHKDAIPNCSFPPPATVVSHSPSNDLKSLRRLHGVIAPPIFLTAKDAARLFDSPDFTPPVCQISIVPAPCAATTRTSGRASITNIFVMLHYSPPGHLAALYSGSLHLQPLPAPSEFAFLLDDASLEDSLTVSSPRVSWQFRFFSFCGLGQHQRT